MFTLNNILGVARGAIAAQQTAVQVASNNIANANTEGYTRQRVQMRPGQPIDTALGPAATGVRIAAYERMRDPLLDVSFRRDQGKSAASDMRRDLMREIEGVYGEPSDTGLGATMDAFWSAWEDLAGDPLSDAARGMVRQRAVQLTTGLNNAAEGLDTVGANALSRLRDSVTRLNDLGEEVARLNVEIVAAEAGGASANDLRDARDRAIDQMSGLRFLPAAFDLLAPAETHFVLFLEEPEALAHDLARVVVPDAPTARGAHLMVTAEVWKLEQPIELT